MKKPLVTSSYPIRHISFNRPGRIVVSRQARTEPRQGMEAVVYAEFRSNPFWKGITDDGVYVEVTARRTPGTKEWTWLVDASATRPSKHREQTGAHTRCSTLDQALILVRAEIKRLAKWIESNEGAKAKSS